MTPQGGRIGKQITCVDYSYRKASAGSNCAARIAGSTPARAPTKAVESIHWQQHHGVTNKSDAQDNPQFPPANKGCLEKLGFR